MSIHSIINISTASKAGADASDIRMAAARMNNFSRSFSSCELALTAIYTSPPSQQI